MYISPAAEVFIAVIFCILLIGGIAWALLEKYR